MKKKSKVFKYQDVFEVKKKFGISKLGLMTNKIWQDDPKRMPITLSRYKFVSKMLEGKKNVLEVGCGDSFQNRIVGQVVSRLTAIDINKDFIKDARKNNPKTYNVNHYVHNILEKPFRVQGKNFDAAYSLDVLEHIEKKSENLFIKNILSSLDKHGVFIVGMPSIESQKYASEGSKRGHVNCKTGNKLKELLSKHFCNVFVFSMNDEVVHTGFYPMAHYLIGLCCGKK
tara:strand:- start:18701 stop:19384 length:684 start_codon:yes stop_codon:yes gene_type:complete